MLGAIFIGDLRAKLISIAITAFCLLSVTVYLIQRGSLTGIIFWVSASALSLVQGLNIWIWWSWKVPVPILVPLGAINMVAATYSAYVHGLTEERDKRAVGIGLQYLMGVLSSSLASGLIFFAWYAWPDYPRAAVEMALPALMSILAILLILLGNRWGSIIAGSASAMSLLPMFQVLLYWSPPKEPLFFLMPLIPLSTFTGIYYAWKRLGIRDQMLFLLVWLFSSTCWIMIIWWLGAMLLVASFCTLLLPASALIAFSIRRCLKLLKIMK